MTTDYLYPISLLLLIIWCIAGWVWIERATPEKAIKKPIRNVLTTIAAGPLFWVFSLVFLWANRQRNE